MVDTWRRTFFPRLRTFLPFLTLLFILGALTVPFLRSDWCRELSKGPPPHKREGCRISSHEGAASRVLSCPLALSDRLLPAV